MKEDVVIPVDGARYDFYIKGHGFHERNPDLNRWSDELIIRCVIDNGVIQGKELSNKFVFKNGYCKEWIELEKLLPIIPPKGYNRSWNNLSAMAPFLRELRFSAVIRVKYSAKAKNGKWREVDAEYQSEPNEKKIATYTLVSFDKPQSEPEIKPVKRFPSWRDL